MPGTPRGGAAETTAAVLLYGLHDTTVTASLLAAEDGSVLREPASKVLSGFSPEQFGLTVPMLWDLVDTSGASIVAVVVSGACAEIDVITPILELAFGVPVFDAAPVSEPVVAGGVAPWDRARTAVASGGEPATAMSGGGTPKGSRPVPAKPVRRNRVAGAAAAGAAAAAGGSGTTPPLGPAAPRGGSATGGPASKARFTPKAPSTPKDPSTAPDTTSSPRVGAPKSGAAKMSLGKPAGAAAAATAAASVASEASPSEPVAETPAVDLTKAESGTTAIVGGVAIPADADTESFPVVPGAKVVDSDARTESIPVVPVLLPPPPEPRSPRRLQALVGVAALALVAAGIGSAVVLSAGSDESPPQNAASTLENRVAEGGNANAAAPTADVPVAGAPAAPPSPVLPPPPVDDPATAIDESVVPPAPGTPPEAAAPAVAPRVATPWTSTPAAPPPPSWTAPPAASNPPPTSVTKPPFAIPVPESDPSKSPQQLQDEAWARHWAETGQWLNQELVN